jgi:hypothetical protein
MHPYASTKPLTEARLYAPGVVLTKNHKDNPGFSSKWANNLLGVWFVLLWTIAYSPFEKGKWSKRK